MATVADQAVVGDQSTARLQTVAKMRPTETLTIAGAAAFVLARVFGVDNDNTMTALTVVIGFLPAAITWLVHLVVAPRGAAVTAGHASQVLAVAPLQELQAKIVSALEELVEQARESPALQPDLQQRSAILRELLTSLRATG